MAEVVCTHQARESNHTSSQQIDCALRIPTLAHPELHAARSLLRPAT